MSGFFDWIINLKTHEIILWILVVVLLLWELIIKRKTRKSLESGIDKLRSQFLKLGLTTELSKKEIGELYKRFDLTKREIERIKQIKREVPAFEKHVETAETELEVGNEHIFILRLLEDSEEKHVLASFIPAYFLDTFKDKNKDHYKSILSKLLDHNLIKLFSVGDKIYVEITRKGIDFLRAVEKIE